MSGEGRTSDLGDAAAKRSPQSDPTLSRTDSAGEPTTEGGTPGASRVPSLGHRALAWLGTTSGLTFLVIAGFVAIGSYERLAQLGQASLWADEAQSTLVAFSVLQHGYPIIVSPHVIDNWEPLYPYFEALSIRLLGDSNLAYRLPSALFGIALIPISYLIGARLRDRYVGIAFAGMVALSTEYIAWSRQARWYTLLVVLMALGLLTALTWYRSHASRRRALCLIAMVVLGILAGTASIGVFLLYVPGLVAAGLAYLVALRWDSVRRFFGRPPTTHTGQAVPPPRLVPYRWRLPIILGPVVAVIIVLAADSSLTWALYRDILTPIFGYSPFPPVWSANIPSYLVNYYPGILAVAILGGLFIVLRRDPFDLALVTLCVVSLVTVTVGGSFAADVAGGGVSPARHLLPLIYFLFLLASLGIVEGVQRIYQSLRGSLRLPRPVRVSSPALFGFGIVVLLVLPCAVVPSGQTLYQNTWSSPADGLIPWVAFSLDPAHPSALYHTDQANYQLASDYVLNHRNSTDVVGATDCGPPAVYLGSVQYWIRGNARPGTTIQVDGKTEFQQTGSVLISNTSQLEGILYASAGWFVSDKPRTASPFYPGGMSLVLEYFMTEIPVASDNSIWLYHWNQSTPVTLLEMLQSRYAALQHLGTNLTRLVNWAEVGGVTSSSVRDLLLPMEAALLPYVAPNVLPLAVLVNVYNHRPDLQKEFPQMLQNSSNDTPLVHWAYEVTSGQLSDPAEPVLAPYVAWYQSHS